MEFLDPDSHKLWKSELHTGHANPQSAKQTDSILGRIHAGTADSAKPEARFPRADIFQAIRLEPYLEATAAKHPDLKDILFGLSHRTAATRLAMIHGDVSPKNILIGPNGPLFLDAECACIGDPTFDLAFCLNHFLLKCLWIPPASDDFLACFTAMTSSYLAEVTWEEVDQLEARAASLLPGLLLARVDGKSPAEYITAENDKDKVRRWVWDSRGRPTVEAEVHLADGSMGRAIAPAGASTGSREAVDKRDGGSAFNGLNVMQAVGCVNGEIAKLLKGRDVTEQAHNHQTMIELDGTPNKNRLGSNALVATSMAMAHAAAAGAKLPLWRYLGGDHSSYKLPLPEIQIFGGGAHARRRVDVQDFMVIAMGANSYEQSLEWTAEVYGAAAKIMSDAGLIQGVADEGGFWPAFNSNEQALDFLVRSIEQAGFIPGDQIGISLDIAATDFYKNGQYVLATDNKKIDSDGLSEMLLQWIDRYPIIAIEDPLSEDDDDATAKFTQAAGCKVEVIDDDFICTTASRIENAAAIGACNTALIKPNQAGTLTEAKAALDAANVAGWQSVVSARSGESKDTTIIHLSIGWGVKQLKVGSFIRSERMAKWNEGLRVAEALGQNGGDLFDRSSIPWG